VTWHFLHAVVVCFGATDSSATAFGRHLLDAQVVLFGSTPTPRAAGSGAASSLDADEHVPKSIGPVRPPSSPSA
jgi:hypothetical protein